MKISAKILVILALCFSIKALAQEPDIEEMFDAEVEAVEQTPENDTIMVDEEQASQQQVLKRKEVSDSVVSDDPSQNRFPKDEPLFVKPKGPKQGGSVRVPHPNAAKGLLRINPDGSYQYKLGTREKSRSGSFRISSMTPPEVTGPGGLGYEDIYGSQGLIGVLFGYEWQPFTSFGRLGVTLESGFSTTTGKGRFKRNAQEESEESYSLFVVPASVFVTYRFEYVSRQWIVPFLMGGGTFYGLAEIRDDGDQNNFTNSAAVGGGGGIHISLSRLDIGTGFTLAEEYGIADMWLTIEARAMQGTNQEIDFTHQAINAGITVDY